MARRFTWLLALLVGAFLCLSYFGSLSDSLTIDEPTFITAGYWWLGGGELAQGTGAPQLLAKIQAGLPLLLLRLQPPELKFAPGHAPEISELMGIFERNQGQVREVARWARLPVILIGGILVAAVGLWGRSLFGPAGGLAAAGVAAFWPDLIAHAKLATTDLPCAAGMFVAMWSLWRATRPMATRCDWVLCGAATGVALMTKFTSLLLGPMYLVIGAVLLVKRRTTMRRLLAGGTLGLVSIFVVVAIGYWPSLNPLGYLRDFRALYGPVSPGYYYYLCGRLSLEPFWYYYLVAFLLKTPLPILLLLGWGAGETARRHADDDRLLFVVLPAVLVLTASCFDPRNLGVRRILPAYPLLALLAGGVAARLVERERDSRSDAAPAWRRGRTATLVLVLLIAWTVVEGVRTWPNHLSYFSQAVGGARSGALLLDDSNIDWGQDLVRLSEWVRAHPEARPLRIAVSSSLPPALYGLDLEEMRASEVLAPRPGSWYAVSAHVLVYFRKQRVGHPETPDWLTAFTPVARVGGSIYVYHFPPQGA